MRSVTCSIWSREMKLKVSGETGAIQGSSLCAVRVDLTLSDGRRVLVEGPTALVAVLGLVEGLMS